MNMMNQMKRIGVIKKKRYVVLVGSEHVLACRGRHSQVAGHYADNNGPSVGEVMGSISEAIMNTLKRILRAYNAVLLVLFAGFLLPVSAQSQESESLIVMAKGHGIMSSVVEERKLTSALVVLRQNGTMLITVTAELQLQAEGTWKATAASPEDIVLNITGGVLEGEMAGSGKLLLTSDRKSFKELTMNIELSDGQEVTVTFVADASEPPN
jgi:hypothetical protein